MKTIGYRTSATARRKYEDFFAGRPGCHFFEITQDDFDEDDNWAPGGYIEGPDAIIDAWDAALKKIRVMRIKTGTAEMVKAALDAAT